VVLRPLLLKPTP